MSTLRPTSRAGVLAACMAASVGCGTSGDHAGAHYSDDPRTRSPQAVAVAFYRAVTRIPPSADHADVSGLTCPNKKLLSSDYISLSRSPHTVTATARQNAPSDWHVSLVDRSDGGSSSTTVVYDVIRLHGRYLVCGQLS